MSNFSFSQCFQKACFPGASEGVIVWEWIKTGFHPLSQLTIVSRMIMWESSQWLGKNARRSNVKINSWKAWIGAHTARIQLIDYMVLNGVKHCFQCYFRYIAVASAPTHVFLE